MPTPKPEDETREEFLDRCIPAVLDDGAAKDEDQAVAMCSTMWSDAAKKSARRMVRRAAMKPEANESQESFMERCVPRVLDGGEAADEDQAVEMCSMMWDQHGKGVGVPHIIRRAYGLFGEVKSLDDDKRIVEGIATTPTPDRMNDVVDPLGARYNLPIPLLYQHSSDAPVGEVIDARVTKAGIKVTARVFKAQHSRLLKERLDEAWESLSIGLLKGFSIGFAPLSPPEIIEKTAGYYYRAWEWLELSVVTIPANAEATVSLVKSIYQAERATRGGKKVVTLDPVTLAKAMKQIHPGVVYLK